MKGQRGLCTYLFGGGDDNYCRLSLSPSHPRPQAFLAARGRTAVGAHSACSDSQMSDIPESVVIDVQKIIDSATWDAKTNFAGNAILTCYRQVMDILATHNISYKLELEPGLILTHPKNRGGLGVNPHNVHKKGRRIIGVGGDRAKVHEAVCFEGHPASEAQVRDKEINFNKKLVASSGGLLAPIKGSERYFSVGCSHLAQFCRAIRHGCRTTQMEIADSEGCLDMAKIRKDPGLMAMLEQGWEWTIIPWQAHSCWPTLAHFIQGALNADNEVGEGASELEVAASIAAFAATAEKSDVEPDWESCVSAAISAGPSCSSYACILKEYCRKYGGGPGSPMVMELDAYAKKHSMTLKLGEEFWRAVVQTQICEANAVPRVRNAILLCQLTAPTHTEGIAKLLSKSDVGGLKDEKKVGHVIQLEKDLQLLTELITELASKGHADQDKAINLLNLFKVRAIAHIVGKGKHTFDGRAFDSYKAVCDKFWTELANISSVSLAKPVGSTGSTTQEACDPDQTTEAASSESSTQPLGKGSLSMDQVNCPIRMAKEKGFAVGEYCYKKGQDKLLFKITDITSQTVKLMKHEVFVVPSFTTSIDFPVLMKEWTPYKSDVQTLVDSEWRASRSIACADQYKIDIAKSSLFLAMSNYAETIMHDANTAIHLSTKPTGVFARSDIPRGALQLVPLVLMSGIGVKGSSGTIATETSVTTTTGKVYLHIHKPTQTYKPSMADWDKGVCCNPFFWVQKDAGDMSANLKLTTIEHMGYKFPVLKNSVVIKKHTELVAAKQDFEAPAAPDNKKRRKS